MKKTILLFSIIFSYCSLSTTTLFGQDEISKDIVLEDPREIQYAVKFAPVQMMSGQFNFSFEAAIHERGALEVSLGPTFGAVGFAPLDLFGITNSNIILGNSKLGFNASLGYRYYAIKSPNTNLAGLYLSPVIKYNLLRSFDEEVFDSEFVFSRRSFSKANLFVFTVQTGYQFVFKSGLVLDMFVGTGFGHRSFASDQVMSNFDGQNTYDTHSFIQKKDFYVAFTTGLRIGFGSQFKSKK